MAHSSFESMVNRLYRVIFFISLVIIVLLCLALGAKFYSFVRAPFIIAKEGYVLTILPGSSVQRIANTLEKDGLISHPKWFMAWVRWQGAWSTLKAGEYLVKEGTTPTALIQQIVEGRVIQYPLTIVPGWTFARLLQELQAAPKLNHTLVGLKKEEIMEKLGHPNEHPEGRFFPETYYYTAGMTDAAVLNRAYALLNQKLTDLWKARDASLPLQSPYEVLILASIVEKESALSEEYPEIAGVFIRRLVKNMPLQADPTVIYGAGEEYLGRIEAAMLKKDNPYNTYQRIGLPPTPIALPSLKALEAATRPKPGETLYFVAKSKKKEEGHTFSKTLEEHAVKVLEYRKRLLEVN